MYSPYKHAILKVEVLILIKGIMLYISLLNVLLS